MAAIVRPPAGPAPGGRFPRNQPTTKNAMEEHVSEELVAIIKRQQPSEFEEAFERAFELTKSYAGSANAQASAIPFVFEKLFELFVTGRTKS